MHTPTNQKEVVQIAKFNRGSVMKYHLCVQKWRNINQERN